MARRVRRLLRQLEDIELTIADIRGDVDYMAKHGDYAGIADHLDRLEDFVTERVYLLNDLGMSRMVAIQEILAMRKRGKLRVVE